jgi:hypothetical protein
MMKPFFLIAVFLILSNLVFAQERPLPFIQVKNLNNKIIVSWINDYTKPITALNIQRSYDSLQNFNTIGSVLSPQSRENGFADVNFPYNKMYYRVNISFEGGSYIITTPARPVKENDGKDNISSEKYPWLVSDKDSGIVFPPTKPGITYPSSTIFTAKDNNIIIHLENATIKKYTVKFFDEAEKFIFELSKLKEEYLIIEKVNFVHTGWFRFELYENGLLIENNKFQILKELKKL